MQQQRKMTINQGGQMPDSTINMNDRNTLLALPLHQKEIICNAYAAALQQRLGDSYSRIPRVVISVALWCGMWWLLQIEELQAGFSNASQIFGFDVRLVSNGIVWIVIVGLCALLVFELWLARKTNRDQASLIERARRLGADVKTIDAWLLNKIEAEVVEKYKSNLEKVPVEFKGQEWKYKFNPDRYNRYRGGFSDWLECVGEKEKVYEGYFEAILNGERIEPESLRRDLNRTSLKFVTIGVACTALAMLFVSIDDIFSSIWNRSIIMLALIISQVLILRILGYTRRSESIRFPSSFYGKTINGWAKYHQEIHPFVTRNGLYSTCSDIEFYLVRHYIHVRRVEIFKAEKAV